jgi:hypothetical protein
MALGACTNTPPTQPTKWTHSANNTISYDGEIQIGNAKIPCSNARRGTLRFTENNTTKDNLLLCVENSTGDYEYVEVTP